MLLVLQRSVGKSSPREFVNFVVLSAGDKTIASMGIKKYRATPSFRACLTRLVCILLPFDSGAPEF
jgi:hypothetical protein